ncbi:MAG: hypothetical protein ACRDNG_13170, partial [Gaiellaceae bacterium]
ERAGPCERLRGDTAPLVLPPGGATLRAEGGGPADLTLGRFATTPSVELGALPPGETETLAIPTDASPTPWRAAIQGARSVEVCALR